LYFGRILGTPSLRVHTAATAIIEWGRPIGFRPTSQSGPTSLLPFTMAEGTYHDALEGISNVDEYRYTDNYPDGSTIPEGPLRVSQGTDDINEVILYPSLGPGGWETGQGNFGTIDLGGNDNSEAVLVRQILYGVSAQDLAAWGGEFIVGTETTPTQDLQGDTGLSAGMKDELASIIGKPRSILLYSQVVDPGNNAIFTIVEIVGIVILEVDFTGNPKLMRVQPATCVDDSVIIGDPPPGDDSFPTVVRPPRLIH
jgi:hypothetical protein